MKSVTGGASAAAREAALDAVGPAECASAAAQRLRQIQALNRERARKYYLRNREAVRLRRRERRSKNFGAATT